MSASDRAGSPRDTGRREDESSLFVTFLLLSAERRQPPELGQLGAERLLASQAIERSVAGGGDDPAERAGGNALPGPALNGTRERVLNGVFSQVEIVRRADQRRDSFRPGIPEDPLDQDCITGRTSTAPRAAAGIRAAIWSASSRFSQSIR